jgi:hypothetical protein
VAAEKEVIIRQANPTKVVIRLSWIPIGPAFIKGSRTDTKGVALQIVTASST